MRLRHLFIFISVLILVACESEEMRREHGVQSGRFSLVAPQAYGSLETKSMTVDGDRIFLSITEAEWGAEDGLATRGTLDDNATWPDIPLVGLYATNMRDTLMYGDVAINPVPVDNHYKAYHTYCSFLSGTERLYPEEGDLIQESGYLWDRNFKEERIDYIMRGLDAKFIGYYPRPNNNIQVGGEWRYRKQSIVDESSARDLSPEKWNELTYAFELKQTDENLAYHDLMYAAHRDVSKGGDVRLEFNHLFTLLDIRVYRGDKYEGAGNLNSITLLGTKIYTEGTLDLITGKTTQNMGAGQIVRTFDNVVLSDGASSIQTRMIVQPCAVTKGRGEFGVSVMIDNSAYTCYLPAGTRLEPGRKYAIDLILDPSENGQLIFRVWDGAYAEYNGTTFNYGGEALNTVNFVPGVNQFKVSSNTKKVFLNSVEQPLSADGVYTLPEMKKGMKVNCDIVTEIPTGYGWYIMDDMRIHFDAIKNSRFDDGHVDNSQWQDLSGHGNDGTLMKFGNLVSSATNNSGWMKTADGRYGLVLDGIDDRIDYPGTINADQYSMEFCICVPAQHHNNNWAYPRLNAEGGGGWNSYPCVILTHTPKTTALATNQYKFLALMGNNRIGHNTWDKTAIDKDGKTIYHIVLTYDMNGGQLNGSTQWGKVTFYINGELAESLDDKYRGPAGSLPVESSASLGARSDDNTRSLQATYYSFILYDKALTAEEVRHNYNVSVNRYGTIR